jgi:hypothetical protein
MCASRSRRQRLIAGWVRRTLKWHCDDTGCLDSLPLTRGSYRRVRRDSSGSGRGSNYRRPRGYASPNFVIAGARQGENACSAATTLNRANAVKATQRAARLSLPLGHISTPPNLSRLE